MFCEFCGQKLPEGVEKCPNCNAAVRVEPDQGRAGFSPREVIGTSQIAGETAGAEHVGQMFKENEVRYKSLRFYIKIINPVLGWLVIVGGILGSSYWGTQVSKYASMFGESPMWGFLAFLIGVVGSVVGGISTFAWGNLLQCFIDIEENTEATIKVLGNDVRPPSKSSL